MQAHEQHFCSKSSEFEGEQPIISCSFGVALTDEGVCSCVLKFVIQHTKYSQSSNLFSIPGFNFAFQLLRIRFLTKTSSTFSILYGGGEMNIYTSCPICVNLMGTGEYLLRFMHYGNSFNEQTLLCVNSCYQGSVRVLHESLS